MRQSGEPHFVTRPICSFLRPVGSKRLAMLAERYIIHCALYIVHCSRSHAAGCAQRGEDCRDDACKNLQECLYAFFLHSRLVFVLIIRFLIRGEGLSLQTSALFPQPSLIILVAAS